MEKVQEKCKDDEQNRDVDHHNGDKADIWSLDVTNLVFYICFLWC